MNILFDCVMPKPLASISHGSTSIWGDRVTLKSGHKIILNASSGKGKSTFSSTIFGLRTDYTGTIYYDDRNIRTLTIDDWVTIRKQKISIVFQDLQLFHNLTVLENLMLKNNLTRYKSEQEIIQMLAAFDIEHKLQEPCGLLSMGQQQRLSLIHI
jgi:ABC-type lipoprotein export system ATPase subunit